MACGGYHSVVVIGDALEDLKTDIIAKAQSDLRVGYWSFAHSPSNDSYQNVLAQALQHLENGAAPSEEGRIDNPNFSIRKLTNSNN
jgi:hypothetical protein